MLNKACRASVVWGLGLSESQFSCHSAGNLPVLKFIILPWVGGWERMADPWPLPGRRASHGPKWGLLMLGPQQCWRESWVWRLPEGRHTWAPMSFLGETRTRQWGPRQELSGGSSRPAQGQGRGCG